jgi:aminoglycoside phosphotransferase (APT) family kinase protein
VISGAVNRLQRLRDHRGLLVRREWPAPALAAALGIDPDVEVAAQRLAAEHGLAPPVLEFDPQARFMLMPFVAGVALEADWLERADRRVAMRELFVRLRSIAAPELPGLDLVARVRELHTRLGQLRPEAAGRWQALLESCVSVWQRDGGQRARSADDAEVLVHGDLIPRNVIVRPDGSLCLIDWEYAHRGHGDEDLAGLAPGHEVAPAAAQQLLDWSLQPTRLSDRRQLRRLLDGLWLELVAAQGLEESRV